MNKDSVLKRLLSYVGQYKLTFFLSFIFALISVVATLLIPIQIGRAIDVIIGKDNVDFNALFDILITTGLIVIVLMISQFFMSFCNNRVTFRVSRKLRDDAFNKLSKVSINYIDQHPHGDIVSRVISDVDLVSDGLLIGFTQLFTGVITIIGTLFFLFRVNLLIALSVVLITPVSLIAAFFLAKKTHKYFAALAKEKGNQTALIDEMITGHKEVETNNRLNFVMDEFDSVNKRWAKNSLLATFYSSLVNPTTRFVNSIVYAVVCLLGGFAAIARLVTVGDLSVILTYATQYTKPFNEISGVVTELQSALVSAKRIFEVIDAESETNEEKVLGKTEGNVIFKDVAFSYNKDKSFIENINITANKGERIAIVGPTGCGKTTLINLIMRFYDIDSGSIAIDGESILSVSRKSVRSNVGMILQDSWIKTGTVRENIALSRPNATIGEIIEAAKMARCHDFILRLENGYDTYVTNENNSFSQGQKQLLCIARVMLSLPPILILDEATSNIDTRTELLIQDSFQTLMKGRTSFVVAHRLASIQSSDQIVVMKDGHIEEIGKHKALLEKKGLYSELYYSQFAFPTEGL